MSLVKIKDPYYVSCYNRVDIKWNITKVKDPDKLNCHCDCPLEYIYSCEAVNANITRHYYRCSNCLQAFVEEKKDGKKSKLFSICFTKEWPE